MSAEQHVKAVGKLPCAGFRAAVAAVCWVLAGVGSIQHEAGALRESLLAQLMNGLLGTAGSQEKTKFSFK